jgi:hypothetical protein
MAHRVGTAMLAQEALDRARSMDGAERLREGLLLFDRALGLMHDGLRYRFPDDTDEERAARLARHLERLRALDAVPQR